MARENSLPLIQTEMGTWMYNEDRDKFQLLGLAFPVSNGDPDNLEEGMVWIDSSDNKLYVYYNGTKKEIADLS